MESEETWRKLSLDLAWAAGLFDGEGCTSARPYKNRPGSVRIQASVSQSSHSAELVPSVLQRFQRSESREASFESFAEDLVQRLRLTEILEPVGAEVPKFRRGRQFDRDDSAC